MIQTRRPIPAQQIKLLLWDLDGTLVDSELDLAHSINAMLRHLKRPELPIEVVASFIGDGAPMLVRRSLGDPQDEDFVQSALEFFMHHYREHKLDHTYVYPGVMDVLCAIRENSDIRMAVLSNKPVGPSRGICDGLNLSAYMTKIYGGNSFSTKKPDPQGALALLDEHGVRAEQAIMVGDSQNDVLTADNAGMFSIGVTYGLSPESLKVHPPDVLIDHPKELLELLGLATHPKR
ncbi:MAG: haloacid dehalogenase [Acidobacteria bacterium]|nr:MAG: haloacid dehalogenase [Acidobacteriota bacterium]